ncbi:unnamed protein product, partial [Mesorhabditis spiculigera]
MGLCELLAYLREVKNVDWSGFRTFFLHDEPYSGRADTLVLLAMFMDEIETCPKTIGEREAREATFRRLRWSRAEAVRSHGQYLFALGMLEIYHSNRYGMRMHSDWLKQYVRLMHDRVGPGAMVMLVAPCKEKEYVAAAMRAWTRPNPTDAAPEKALVWAKYKDGLPEPYSCIVLIRDVEENEAAWKPYYPEVEGEMMFFGHYNVVNIATGKVLNWRTDKCPRVWYELSELLVYLRDVKSVRTMLLHDEPYIGRSDTVALLAMMMDWMKTNDTHHLQAMKSETLEQLRSCRAGAVRFFDQFIFCCGVMQLYYWERYGQVPHDDSGFLHT